MLLTFTVTTHALDLRDPSETVKGVGLGIEWYSVDSSPAPALGLIYAKHYWISLQGRVTYAYRPSVAGSIIRAGFGGGYGRILVNADLSWQSGAQNSLGMLLGLSTFWGENILAPEIFIGYQMQNSTSAENSFVAGVKCYLNTVHMSK